MINDLFSILTWWFLIFSLGVIFLPSTFSLFSKFFDKGYALSKILGILFVSYLVWLCGSLKILPFTKPTIYLIIVLVLIVNFFLSKREKTNFKKILKENWQIFLLEEILFSLCLIFWSFIRGFQPDIHGLEKFMDFGFVNSILRSKYFPPADMWLAGKTINYYYFGHLKTAVLTKISSLDSAIAYNLMIATLFALSLTAAFSLGSNFVFSMMRKPPSKRQKRLVIILGLFSALTLTLGGNLHSLYWFLTHHFSFANYWYPDATRFIVQEFGAADNTIHEFPIYSFVVADLHGHLINLPMVLLFLSLIFSFFTNKKFLIGIPKESREAGNWKLEMGNLILPALMLGVFYMTNAWDFPIYLLVLGAVIFWFNYLNYGLRFKIFLRTLLLVACCLLLSIILTLPFHLQFKSIAEGIGLVDFHSPLWMLLVLWGFPLYMTISLLLFLKKQKLKQVDFFILILLFVSWFLIIIPEFFYIKDIYIHSYQRANTMFKFTYQSFVMFSLSSGYILFRILSGLKKRVLKFLFSIFCFLFSIFIFIYPSFAIRSYYGLKNYQGLNGLAYLKNLYPDDYQAILWLRKNISGPPAGEVGQPVIAEAVGESYTDFARVSANTGLPTILGWRVHEWLWRGSFDEASQRTEEVKEIYETTDLTKTRELLSKYQVKYVFIGSLEKEAYPQLKEAKFAKIGEKVFELNQTTIYQLNP